ncbi:MAG: endolytic transglycosylase MltG, partial [Acidimicrobiaceae bacterium]|nr:endolytic transglycosylase MltG [Acidimicrobiaceae bacterium]
VLPPGYGGTRRTHGRHSGRRHGQPSATGTRRRHPVLWSLLAILVVIILVAAGGFIWARRQINPGGHPGSAVTVVIPKGASTGKIADVLASHGVIHSGTLFRYYIKLEGDGPLYPGTYQLRKNSSYDKVIGVLSKPPVIITDKLTIPEGFTIAQIAQRLAALPKLHLSAQKFLAAATSGQVRSPYEPAGKNNLEGLLFPDTYQVKEGESEVDVLETMVGEFNDQAQQLGLAQAAHARGLTPYQIVTVASLVEREAKLSVDRGPVASVIYNRLKAPMALQVDATQVYWLRLSNPNVKLTRSVLLQPSPYNTYTNMGLPPTPIANPGVPSLQAAISPPITRYLYYVTVKHNGQMGYASTNAGFEQLLAQCHQANTC